MLKNLKLPYKTHRERDNDQHKGKKRYRERLVEEKEAEQEIKEYDRQEPIERTNESHPTGLASAPTVREM